ncbi:hypothetical protein [Sulfitobacter geojensis]|uniref:Uncharacterized protein n=1 Tax=Sulfitobacter geojensis TaxID=1342299 RepID=A0AAE3B7T8_9RHOB|nr:hypothetical protein [Sulfitobacter geojensis]MBM1690574.1 hypothetical protein [Sulfitobacter geojensis]MBM1694640.1 hypothetical protein [Sulfitobacter geojensis]MBM1706806.1 hypothetical protein [Sulfitobacter geojensis]MBM1710864.1 hypothetical protein [Sulfitobacter geojensis]MBM1714930.1 hypothetical protein [Sulfitobacter geojensis]
MTILVWLNNFIAENQALIVTVGLPSLTILIGLFGTYLLHKSKSDELRLTGRIKLADLRSKNFDELKQQVTIMISSLAYLAYYMEHEKENHKESEMIKALNRSLNAAEEVMLRIRSNKRLVDDFWDAVSNCTDQAINSRGTEDEAPIIRVRTVCHQIIDFEWEQVEAELKGLR